MEFLKSDSDGIAFIHWSGDSVKLVVKTRVSLNFLAMSLTLILTAAEKKETED